MYKNPYCIAYVKDELFNPHDDTGKRYVNSMPQTEPVNGKVWPPTQPPEDKPRQNTNQLQYLLKVVHKAVLKHKHAWPFETPVDTKSLKLPDYHSIIKKPMDFTTIKRRLENYWYYDAYECIDDFRQIFVNCYTYNKPLEDVVMMAHHVEELFLDKVEEMPANEIILEIPAPKQARRKQKGGKRPSGKYVDGSTPTINRTSSSNALLHSQSNVNIDGSSTHSQLLDSMSPALSTSNQSIQFSHDASQAVTSNNIASQHATNLDNKQSLLAKSFSSSGHHSKSSGLHDGSSAHLHNQILSNHVDALNPSSSNLPPPHGSSSPSLGKSLIELIVFA